MVDRIGSPEGLWLNLKCWLDPEDSREVGHAGLDTLKRIILLRHRRGPCQIVDKHGIRPQVEQGQHLQHHHRVEGLSKQILQAPGSAPRWRCTRVGPSSRTSMGGRHPIHAARRDRLTTDANDKIESFMNCG